MKKTIKDYLKYNPKRTRLEWWIYIIVMFMIAYLVIRSSYTKLSVAYVFILPALLDLFIYTYHFFHDDSDNEGDKEDSSEDE